MVTEDKKKNDGKLSLSNDYSHYIDDLGKSQKNGHRFFCSKFFCFYMKPERKLQREDLIVFKKCYTLHGKGNLFLKNNP